jgi:hypothetical protein
MCSIPCWILSIWEALGCNFCIFSLIHALSTRGRSLSMFWSTECIWRVFRWFRAISGLCCAPVWLVEVTGQSVGPIYMLRTGLTGGVDRSDRSELSWCSCSVSSSGLHAFVQGSCIASGGACMCARGALCGFRALDRWFVLFAWAWFCLDVSSRCPCLRGPSFVFFKWSCYLPFFGFRSLVGVSFSCFFSFPFLLITKTCVLSMHSSRGRLRPGVVRGPVDGRFLDSWVIDNVMWTDSWLSIAGAGAGEEQARKVIAGEASRCGEDK